MLALVCKAACLTVLVAVSVSDAGESSCEGTSHVLVPAVLIAGAAAAAAQQKLTISLLVTLITQCAVE